MEKIELQVSGMDCGGCETSIVKALKQVEGVADATADHQSGRVVVDAEGAPDRGAIETAIRDAGYEVAAG